MSATLRAYAHALRMGQIPNVDNITAGGLHDLGDEILLGLEACEAMAAVDWEIREAAGLDGGNIEHDAVSFPKAWEMVAERIGDDETKLDEMAEELFAIRGALLATGALDPADTTTPLPGLITALFNV